MDGGEGEVAQTTQGFLFISPNINIGMPQGSVPGLFCLLISSVISFRLMASNTFYIGTIPNFIFLA